MSPIKISKTRSEGLYKEKGSKFLAYLYPVKNEDEVKNFLGTLREEHKKARHHCYAYRLGSKGEKERANDDGEPNGSAGLPILNQLYSADLTNTLIVVVRYFGGTKLGLSGLIHAYKEASKHAISNAIMKVYVEMTELKIEFPIASLGEVEKLIRKENLTQGSTDFGENCVFTLSCLQEEDSRIEELFRGVGGLKLLHI